MYMTQALHRSAAQTPDQPATVCGDRVRTFNEHVDRVARLAGGLRELGADTDDRVGILSLNTDRYIESLFAIPWADAVLNPVNIRWSPSEIAYSLEDSETAILIVDDAFLRMVPELRRLAPGLTTVIHAGDNPAPDGVVDYEQLIIDSARIPDARRSGQSLAGIFYTGGTTGAPKGVALSHANLITAALGALAWRNTVLRSNSPRSLHVAPMFHLADFAFLVMTTIIGGTNIALPGFVPEKVAATIQQHGVTDTVLVPTMIQMLVDNPALASYDLSSLRSVVYGASPISPALLERAAKALPEADFFQVYGMTELTAMATMLQASDHDDPKLRRSAGRAMPITELRIVDESDVEVPTGAVGEITVRGGQVMVGYWRQPEATADALREGWMHTGDAGYVDGDGYVYIVDRFKDMIISGGENVYSTEVENALAQHPAVAVPAVIGVPDEQWGEIVHAVVVLKPGATATVDELQAHVRTLIAGYKVPRSIEFVAELPISGAGKILKRALRDSYRKNSFA
ncbi:long-chain-fatty-acid--CoA ligase [Nocardia gamkensis]|uniref:long-chain-fatty-acid--CoA ligase n=1 Tax=Nocardia gamkensis TaxID=352869 RepID=UPI0033D30F5E